MEWLLDAGRWQQILKVSMQAKVLIFLWACKPPKKYSPKIMARDWKASEKNKIVGDNDCYYFGINIWKMSWNCKRSWIDPLGYGDLFSFFFGCGVSSWYRHNYDVTLVAKLSRHRRSAVFFESTVLWGWQWGKSMHNARCQTSGMQHLVLGTCDCAITNPMLLFVAVLRLFYESGPFLPQKCNFM